MPLYTSDRTHTHRSTDTYSRERARKRRKRGVSVVGGVIDSEPHVRRSLSESSEFMHPRPDGLKCKSSGWLRRGSWRECTYIILHGRTLPPSLPPSFPSPLLPSSSLFCSCLLACACPTYLHKVARMELTFGSYLLGSTYPSL
jgi:hypothetical protein